MGTVIVRPDGFLAPDGKIYVKLFDEAERVVIHENVHRFSKRNQRGFKAYKDSLKAFMSGSKYGQLYREYYARYAQVYSYLSGDALASEIEEEIFADITGVIQSGRNTPDVFF